VASIWVGYDQIDANHYLPPEVNGSTYPTWLWRQIVGAALSGKPALSFPGPDGRPQAAAQPAPEPAQPAEPKKPVLPAITALSATPGPQPGSVNLNWQAEGGNTQADNLGFRILRATTPDAPFDEAHSIATAGGPPYLDVLTMPGTYYYRVVAVDKQSGAIGEPSAPLEVKVQLESDKPGDKNPGDGKPDPTDPDDIDPGNRDPDDTIPDGTGPNDPGDTDPNDTDPGDTDPGDSDPSDSDPGDTNPGDTEPGDTDPGDTAPGDTEPDDRG
jgi:hypothetical protein